MSIAAGFFGTLAQGMDDKRQFIRNRIEEDRLYLREQGLQRMAQVNQQRQAYETAARDLITRGANERSVLAALESNPQGLMSMYREVTDRGITNREVINSVFEIADGYNTDASLEEILQTVIPATASLPADTDPTETRRRSIAAWLGLDTEEELNQNVYSQQIVGGMTGDQILASMNIPVNARGTGQGVGFNFENLEEDEVLTQRDATYWTKLSLEEYTPVLQERISTLQQELASLNELDGEMSEEEMARLREINEEMTMLESMSDMTDQQKLEVMLREFGVLPNTQRYFEMYPTLFTPEFGFNVTTMEMFRPEEDTTEEAIPTDVTGDVTPEVTTSTLPEVEPEVEPEGDESRLGTVDNPLEFETQEQAVEGLREFFTMNPNVPEAVVLVDGQVAVVPNPRLTTPTGRKRVRPSGSSGVTETQEREEFIRPTMGATELNTPAIRNAIGSDTPSTTLSRNEREVEPAVRPRTRSQNLEAYQQGVSLVEEFPAAIRSQYRMLRDERNPETRARIINRIKTILSGVNSSDTKRAFERVLEELK